MSGPCDICDIVFFRTIRPFERMRALGLAFTQNGLRNPSVYNIVITRFRGSTALARRRCPIPKTAERCEQWRIWFITQRSPSRSPLRTPYCRIDATRDSIWPSFGIPLRPHGLPLAVIWDPFGPFGVRLGSFGRPLGSLGVS